MPKEKLALVSAFAAPAVATLASHDVASASIGPAPGKDGTVITARFICRFAGPASDLIEVSDCLFGLAPAGYSAAEIEEALEAAPTNMRDIPGIEQGARYVRSFSQKDMYTYGDATNGFIGSIDTGWIKVISEFSDSDTQMLNVWAYNLGTASMNAGAIARIWCQMRVRYEE